MLYALGLGSNVVGDTTYCTYPADARTKPKIGTFSIPISNASWPCGPTSCW